MANLVFYRAALDSDLDAAGYTVEFMDLVYIWQDLKIIGSVDLYALSN